MRGDNHASLQAALADNQGRSKAQKQGTSARGIGKRKNVIGNKKAEGAGSLLFDILGIVKNADRESEIDRKHKVGKAQSVPNERGATKSLRRRVEN